MSRFFYIPILVTLLSCSSSSDLSKTQVISKQVEFVSISAPYDENGWTEEEAIDYLIDKFTYGYTDSLYNEMKAKGVDTWLTGQFNPTPVPQFNKRLIERYPVLALDVKEIGETYPGLVVTLYSIGLNSRMGGEKANLRGNINFNEMFGTTLRNVQAVSRKWFYEMEGGEALREPMKDLGIGNFMELMYQLQAQKLYRAVYSPNQVEEKMTDFWFNHFNVSITRINDVATNVLSYERDAIRPYVFGQFNDMLKATATHPAMLTYLDNTNSEAPEDAKTLVPYEPRQFRIEQNNVRSINENYARELLELHTLGVDGGYTQKDVEEVARILTGWKTSPLIYPAPPFIKKRIENKIVSDGRSVAKDGFYFNAGAHDAGSKTVLGKEYPADRGVEEGYDLLEQLSNHPSTARFISSKIATYFVNDNPSKTLVDRMASRFWESDGNIKQLMKTMVESPEFWDKANIKSKAKSPFEFVVNTLRSSNARLKDEAEVLLWCNRMGQPLFSYQPPTGYPTEATFWLNEAAIVQRIKFSYLLDKNQISGVMIPINNKRIKIAEAFVSPAFQKR